MGQIITYKNEGPTGVFCQIKLDSGERILISITQAEVKVFQVLFGIVPIKTLWSMAAPLQFFDPAFLDVFVYSLIDCRNSAQVVDVLNKSAEINTLKKGVKPNIASFLVGKFLNIDKTQFEGREVSLGLIDFAHLQSKEDDFFLKQGKGALDVVRVQTVEEQIIYALHVFIAHWFLTMLAHFNKLYMNPENKDILGASVAFAICNRMNATLMAAIMSEGGVSESDILKQLTDTMVCAVTAAFSLHDHDYQVNVARSGHKLYCQIFDDDEHENVKGLKNNVETASIAAALNYRQSPEKFEKIFLGLFDAVIKACEVS